MTPEASRRVSNTTSCSTRQSIMTGVRIAVQITAGLLVRPAEILATVKWWRGCYWCHVSSRTDEMMKYDPGGSVLVTDP